MTEQERNSHETFLQYGDLRNAELVFVGLEEGLGNGSVKEAIEARSILFSNNSFKKHRIYINGKNHEIGWFIDNALCLDQAREMANGKQPTPLNKLKFDYKNSLTMRMLSFLHYIKQGGTIEQRPDFKNYQHLNIPGSKSCMIDFFPFPKAGSNCWPEEYKSFFETKNQYYKYYKSPENQRIKIIKNIYENYPLNMTIGYAGIDRGRFKLQSIFEEIGFSFEDVLLTDKLPSGYNGTVSPNNSSPKKFMIGERTSRKGIKQKVILTPFLGMGQLSWEDLYVISGWMLRI